MDQIIVEPKFDPVTLDAYLEPCPALNYCNLRYTKCIC